MKVAIVSQNGLSEINKIKKLGFKIVKKDPDIVISIGGDGTILISERLYPSIPKLAIKTSKTCRKCQYTPLQLKILLEKVKKGDYNIYEENKLEARFNDTRLLALNEIQLHNKKPTVALRFSIKAGAIKESNVIGDGLIIATPFGSTGYYKSVVGKTFKKGIGVAFNNAHNLNKKGFVVDEKTKINVKILREQGWLIRDNDEIFIDLKPGDTFKVYTSKEKAKFIEI